MKIGSVVLNVTDLRRAIAFWTAALGYVISDADDVFAVLRDPDHEWANLSLQLTAEPKRDVNRVHVDLYVDDQTGEVARLESLGATKVEPWPYEPEADSVVMADPDGNEFCVVQRS